MSLVRRRLLRIAALSPFALAGSALWVLNERRDTDRDGPEGMAGPLIGKQVPRFSLPGLLDETGFGDADLRAGGGPVLLNFFASWCLPCAQEAPVLAKLRQGGATIWGIAYRDKPDEAAAFLQRHGDPFARVALDDSGATGIAFDVSGVPETYLVDPRGVVRWSWAGGLSEDIANRSLIPLLHSTLG